MIWLLTAILGVACSIVAAELLDVCPRLTEKLLARAARRLPYQSRERYLAEWYGEYDYMRTRWGKLAILLWATGVNVTSRRLAAELPRIARQRPARYIQLDLFSEPPGTGSADPHGWLRYDIEIPTVIREQSDDRDDHGSRRHVVGRKGVGKLAGYSVHSRLDHTLAVIRLLKRWRSSF
jgi:hypothetical protein